MPSVKTALLAATLLMPQTTVAAPKVYSGTEAQAIRCAQLVFWVATQGHKLGYIDARDQDGIRAYGLYVLSRYTSGSPEQKAKALTQLSKSTPDAISRDKFIKTHSRCTRKFPFAL